ncbi:MAG: hypothetical protein ABI867_37220 [Kofleriaceae bacterium]
MRALVLVLALGCSKAEDATPAKATESAATTPDKPADPAKPASARDGLVDAWKQGGLEPSAWTAADVAFGKDCKSGTVNNVDVVMCLYDTADAAKAAEKPGLEWVGATTGASWTSKTVMVAVADRRKADPSGRTINQLMKLAPK